jgi:hypothetical protein
MKPLTKDGVEFTLGMPLWNTMGDRFETSVEKYDLFQKWGTAWYIGDGSKPTGSTLDSFFSSRAAYLNHRRDVNIKEIARLESVNRALVDEIRTEMAKEEAC